MSINKPTIMAELRLLNTFKKCLIEFLDELIESYPSEGDLIFFRIFLKDQLPITEIIRALYEHLEKDGGKIKKMVDTKNEVFFLTGDNPFDALSKKKSSHFKKLWESSGITPEDKEIIWAWVQRLVLIVYRYYEVKNK
jgi:hypothetical protein